MRWYLLYPQLSNSERMLPCIYRDGFCVPVGRTCHETVVKLCRALSCRYPVHCIVVRPERCGNVANGLRHLASQHHCGRTEAGGKATKDRAGGRPIRSSPGSPRRCRPDIANRSNAISARFNHGETCRTRENLQQLHRWLLNKFQVRQPTLEWVLLGFGGYSEFFTNVQKHTQLQNL